MNRPRLDYLRNRRNTGTTILANFSRVNEKLASVRESDSVKYLVTTMRPVDPEYTQKTFEEANRIQNKLAQGYPLYSVNAEFDHQGSVTNNTHIRFFSDIDLLSLNTNFVDVEVFSGTRYQGDPNQEMQRMRAVCAAVLKAGFPSARVDDSGSKAIKISGGSLARVIDVVPSNWWNTVAYEKSLQKVDRGIKIFNNETQERKGNLPFRHNAQIENLDATTRGNLRKVIRLLKSLKYDANEDAGSEKVAISSYDICGLAYNIPAGQLTQPKGKEVYLATVTYAYLKALEENQALRESIRVPNNTRPVFGGEGATTAGLKALNAELLELLGQIISEAHGRQNYLSEAVVDYDE